MTTTSLRVKRIAYLGVLTALAMIFSYLEYLLPLPMPIPGFKLGLCNVVVMFTAYHFGLVEGATLSLVRVVLSSLLFSSVTGFVFSLFGALFAYGSLVLAKLFLKNSVTFVGVSALSAASFNLGQILAAALLYTSFSVFGYLPLLLVASAVFGSVTGLLLNLLSPRLSRLLWDGKVSD